MNFKFDNLTCEQCSDVIVSITQIVPDFRTVLRFNDLHVKPSKLDLEKKIRYKAPLYYLREEIIVHREYTEFTVKKHMKFLFEERRKEKLGYLKKDLDNVS